VQQEAVLAMLAKEPSHGYQLRAQLRQALGPLGEAMNDGQVYVTLTRLEKAGLAGWLAEVSWPKPDLAEFHLKLIAAAAAGLADPLAIVDTQRRELLRRLRDAERAALAEPADPAAGLLLEGIVLRLQADLRWLETCERSWTRRRGPS
jgi:Transcriptional regulator PadR-like family